MSQPTYSSAVGYISENSFTLSFDAALDGANPPPTNAFDVQVNGVGVSIIGVTVDSAAKTATLTFNAFSLLAGDTIDFSYSDPTGGDDPNALQGTDGADAAPFTSWTTVSGNRPGPSAPSVPVLSSGSDSGTLGDGLTNDATPTVTGTAAAANTVRLYDTDGTTLLGTAIADGSGNWNITSSTLAPGSHALKATQTDNLNVTSPLSTGLTLDIDTVIATPSAPYLPSPSDSGALGDNITDVAMPTLSGTAEIGALVTLYDTNGTTVLGTGTANGAGAWSFASALLDPGVHTLTVKAVDVAGNVSTVSAGLALTVDTVGAAPSGLDLSTASDHGPSTTDNTTNVTTPTITGTSEIGASVTLYGTDGLTPLGTTVADGAGAWTIVSSTLGQGAHTLTAKATDLAGNASAASASLVVTVDTGAPAVSSPDLATGSDDGVSTTDDITTDATPTFTGTAEAGAVIQLKEGSTVLGTATATGGNWSITSSTLAVGSHAVTAVATDLAGNATTATGLVVEIKAPVDSGSTPDPIPGNTTPTGGADSLGGGGADDSIAGGTGDDSMAGAGGADSLDGDAGNDTVGGGEGGDFLRGLSDNDSIDGGQGSDTVNGNMGDDTVGGGDGADTVYGGQNSDVVNGGAGDDGHVNGNMGADTVHGDAGADTVYGGQGSDSVYGDAGDDRVSGDLGDDNLFGGAGGDKFLFSLGGGHDWVIDFSFLDGDRIFLIPNTTYSVSQFQGQVVLDLGHGDIIGLAGVSAFDSSFVTFV